MTAGSLTTVVRVPVLDLPAEVEHHEAVGDGRNHAQVVLDDEQREPLGLHLLHEADETRQAPLVHPARDLVQQQQTRPRGEGPRQLEPLALTRAEAARDRVQAMGEPDEAEVPLGIPPGRGHVARARQRGDHNVVERRHAR